MKQNEIIAKAFTIDGNELTLNYGYNSGGYERDQYFITADGGILSIEAIQREFEKCPTLFDDPDDTQWFIIASEVNYESDDIYCDHTGKQIEPSYNLA